MILSTRCIRKIDLCRKVRKTQTETRMCSRYFPIVLASSMLLSSFSIWGGAIEDNNSDVSTLQTRPENTLIGLLGDTDSLLTITNNLGITISANPYINKVCTSSNCTTGCSPVVGATAKVIMFPSTSVANGQTMTFGKNFLYQLLTTFAFPYSLEASATVCNYATLLNKYVNVAITTYSPINMTSGTNTALNDRGSACLPVTSSNCTESSTIAQWNPSGHINVT